ncbi:helix-turn-helix domain-containing protein [Frankia gtarii]|uniref:helix-turn-helix domain-containing protein n=1 Tax=Frankia gtarii TaxID=2950102 RepID=UPI0027DFC4F6|nr:helix-turn-helix transcriptional regulator [Frankia gtarii]
MAALNVRDLGDFIRDQRRVAQISLRQLAKQAGVSNPYLSQIERGLRRPSAEILQQIAKALRISAEVLYVQAGILEERDGGEDVLAAVLADKSLSERQKQVVLDIYEAFCKENAVAARAGAPAGGTGSVDADASVDGGVGPDARVDDEAGSATAAGGKRVTTAAKTRPAGTARRRPAGRRVAAEAAQDAQDALGAAVPDDAAHPAAPQAPKRRSTRRTATTTSGGPAKSGRARSAGGASPTAATTRSRRRTATTPPDTTGSDTTGSDTSPGSDTTSGPNAAGTAATGSDGIPGSDTDRSAAGTDS